MKRNYKPPRSVLTDADALINGQRRNDYGSAKRSFTHIAMGANFVFAEKLNTPLTSHDIAMFLAIALKGSRRVLNPQHQDSLIDMAGYVGLADSAVLEADEELEGLPGAQQ